MPLKLRSKIILESQDLGSDVVEVAQEGLVPAMVEQLKINATNFLKEYASDNPIEQGASIGNVDVSIHFPNAIEKFQALIEEIKIQNLVTTQCLEKIVTAQTKALADQVKILVEKTAMANHA